MTVIDTSRRPNLRRLAAFVDERAEAAAVSRSSAPRSTPAAAPIDSRAEKRQARRERWRLLIRRPGFIIGVVILLFWIVCAIGGDASRRTTRSPSSHAEPAAEPEH